MTDLASKIFEADDIPSRLVEVPEWDVTLKVRGLTSGETLNIYGSETDDREEQMQLILLRSVLDPETDEHVFSEEDRGEITKKSSKATTRLIAVCMELSGEAADSLEKAKENL